MTLLQTRRTETNPLVTKQAGNNIQGNYYADERIAGKYYRVFPTNLREIKFIQSLEKFVDVFPPAIGQGDGIIIKASYIDNDKVKTTSSSLKLKCMSPQKAEEAGYCAITTKISVDTEQRIILSMQDSMRGKNAIWIVTGKPTKTGDNSGLFVQLGILKSSVLNE